MHDYEYFESEDDFKLNGNEFEGRSFTSRSFNDNVAKRVNKFPKLSEYTRPHFRPTEKTTTSTSTTTTSTTAASTTTASFTKEKTSSTTTASFTNEKTSSTITSTASPTRETTTQSTPSITSLVVNRTNEEKGNSADEVTTSPVATSSYAVKEQNFTINEILEQIDRVDEVLGEAGEVVEVSESSLDETSTVNLSDITEFPDEVDGNESLFATPKGTTVQDETLSSIDEQEFRPRPEYRPAIKPEASTMEGQLYQDAAAKDQQEQPVLKLRGV